MVKSCLILMCVHWKHFFELDLSVCWLHPSCWWSSSCFFLLKKWPLSGPSPQSGPSCSISPNTCNARVRWWQHWLKGLTWRCGDDIEKTSRGVCRDFRRFQALSQKNIYNNICDIVYNLDEITVIPYMTVFIHSISTWGFGLDTDGAYRPGIDGT